MSLNFVTFFFPFFLFLFLSGCNVNHAYPQVENSSEFYLAQELLDGIVKDEVVFGILFSFFFLFLIAFLLITFCAVAVLMQKAKQQKSQNTLKLIIII